jgi:hypothetical protein
LLPAWYRGFILDSSWIHLGFIVSCFYAGVMEREDALQWERIEEAKASLTQTANTLMRSPEVRVEAREALMRLRPQALKALGALETIERLRGLTDEERALQRAFEILLAAARNAG